MARTLVLDTLKHQSNSGTANITLSSDTTTTMPLVDINSGAIDGTTLGAATPSSVAATTIAASGATNLSSTLAVTGNATVGGTFGVTGATSLVNATASGTLGVTGVTTLVNATVGGTLGVTGASTLTGNTTVGGTLGVTGNTTIGGNTTINGSLVLSTVDINGGTIDGTPIGANSASTIVASTISSGAFTGGPINSAEIKLSGDNFWAQGTREYTQNGSQNVSVGSTRTLHNNRNGDRNTAVGFEALFYAGWNDPHDGNTGIGYYAGWGVQGSNNCMIGNESGGSSAPSGYVTTSSNILCIGNNSIGAFYCADTSISSSDGRDKSDVEDFTVGLEWIEALRPVTYQWDKRSWYIERDEENNIISESAPDGTHKQDKKHIGFIGQEVLAVEQAHGFANDKDDMLTVNMNEDDTAYGMKYERLVPVLVNAVKELSAKVKALEAA